MSDLPQRGEVWWCEHPDVGRRPVVVLSRDAAIRGRRRAIVAPCSTHVRHLPSEVFLASGEEPVPLDCVVALDAIEQLGVGLLTSRVGRLSGTALAQICHALAVAVDCELSQR